MTFKGIAFGMKASEIAKLSGGNLESGCTSAIPDEKWTYGGIEDWSASCVESYKVPDRVPGTSGMFMLSTVVNSHNDSYARESGEITYSVEELAEHFSRVFGNFDISEHDYTNGIGQKFIKKYARAIMGAALMEIADVTHGRFHENHITISIMSMDYIKKTEAWEAKQKSEKLKKVAEKLEQAKSDF